MKKPVFADTSFWVAVTRDRDQYRDRAVAWKRWIEASDTPIITTSAVLWEWLNLCSGIPIRETAARGYRGCLTDSAIEVLPWTERDVLAALHIYETRDDKEWSLTDCWSIRVMRARRISDALTADHHFQQAGFRALLLEDPPK